MYEEEDDDLPMQYRRLTAHLQTTNADFDRRLAAYLTNHVAMRSALGAAVSDNYNHQNYINAPQFANNFPQFTQHNFTNPMLPPHMANKSPQTFRQSPYLMPNQPAQSQAAHKRSASIATPQELQSNSKGSPTNAFIKPEDRRLSLCFDGISNPGMMRTPSSGSLANLKHEAKASGSPIAKQDSPHQQPANIRNPYAFGNDFTLNNNNMMPPLSMTLPMESQQLLGPSLDPNDPFSAMLMGKHEYNPQQSFYNYNPNGSCTTKSKPFSPDEGINQTLAPSVLDQNTCTSGHGSYSTPVSNPDSGFTPMSGYGRFGYESQFEDMFKSSASGLTTPNAEHDWANFIDSNSGWEETSSQQTAV